MRKSSLYLGGTLAAVLLFVAAVAGSHFPGQPRLKRLPPELARLQLTDLCLFTEARYTRNPAMADRHAAFQDHPLALEHFPSGSLFTVPAFLAHENH